MTKQNKKLIIVSSIFCLLGLPYIGLADETSSRSEPRNDLLENGTLIHIPGPNPILLTGPPGSWDDDCIESADAFRDGDTYYLYYHATSKEDLNFRLGVATSKHPLGPFKKYEGNPVLNTNPEKGSWDDKFVACAMIMKIPENPTLKPGEGSWDGWDYDKYYMWYSGCSTSDKHKPWGVGLATATNPLGPWKRYEGNPVIEGDFGFVGGVVRDNGKFYLYSASPLHSVGQDYSPISMAVADKPEGPWKKYEGNPVLKPGSSGEWDSGGFSEAEVIHHSGIFHMFYGGAKLSKPRISTRESIGYAYSFDGFNWMKYGLNPVAPTDANPNASAFAEIHAIWESPFIYLYHTYRYRESWEINGFKRIVPDAEDIGVQIIATQKPFSLDIPVMHLENLAAGQFTKLEDTPPICLSHISQLSLSVECIYSNKTTKPIRVHVLASYNGTDYDTTDLYTLENILQPGQLARKSFELECKVKFIKIVVENPDESASVKNLKITATMGG